MRPSWRRYHLVAFGVSVLFALAGCAIERGKVYVKDGKTYGVVPGLTWRGRWWNYYQRGLSYAAGEFWLEAIADFHAAVAQRQDDQRDARTYGLHFVDYFPHRELGIVYYRLGRYDDAIRELATSLVTVETAKAKFYLNRARREQLQQTGRDTAAPRLALDGPADGLRTNQLTVQVTGQAEDDAYVAGVEVHGEVLFIELAEPRLPFAHEVMLSDGPNVIAVTATDLLGQHTSTRVTVYVDRRGPLVSLERVEVLGPPSQRRLHLGGTITDQSPITRFRLAGSEVLLRPEHTGDFQHEIPLGAHSGAVPFEVEDAAGNITRGQIALPVTGAPQGTREGRPALPLLPRWAARHAGEVLSDLSTAPSAPQRLAQLAESAPPMIRLEESVTQQMIYADQLYLEGEVVATSPLVAFTINGEAQLPEEFPQRRQSRRLFFGVMVALQVGENRFRLEARDALGRTAQHEVVVTRHAQELQQLAARLHIAILPLGQMGETSGLREVAYDYLQAAFVQQGRFRLLERARLEDILREQRLSQTAYVERATAIQTGKIATVEGILFGTASEHKQQTLEVLVHFMDVETAQPLASADVYGEDLELRDVKWLMRGLAWKFQQHLPLIEGVVIAREDTHVFVNRGSQHALKQFMKAILFRDGETVTDRRTGKPLGQRIERLGEVRITDVSEVSSQATLLRTVQGHNVRKLDKFITK